MHFGICVNSDMALVQMHDHILLFHFFLCNQHRHAGALRIIILLGRIQHDGTDRISNLIQNLGQSFCTVLLINISNVLFSFLFCTGITNVVHIEAERLRQIVEAEQFKLTSFHEVN